MRPAGGRGRAATGVEGPAREAVEATHDSRMRHIDAMPIVKVT
ncbi:hypothetical protein N566_18065 [Streptomycetaceae bacterium MP113-05]|nr:hypothetical protein N566_18065 [Streptomycetaceae bacterium MP113-05]